MLSGDDGLHDCSQAMGWEAGVRYNKLWSVAPCNTQASRSQTQERMPSHTGPQPFIQGELHQGLRGLMESGEGDWEAAPPLLLSNSPNTGVLLSVIATDSKTTSYWSSTQTSICFAI